MDQEIITILKDIVSLLQKSQEPVTKTLEHTDVAMMVLSEHCDMAEVLGQLGMAWWVSATVMVIGILRYAYEYKREKNTQIPVALMVLVSLFLASIVLFGLVMVYASVKLESEYVFIVGNSLAERVPVKALYGLLIYGYLIGTSSFFIFIIAWVYIIGNKMEEAGFQYSDSEVYNQSGGDGFIDDEEEELG